MELSQLLQTALAPESVAELDLRKYLTVSLVIHTVLYFMSHLLYDHLCLQILAISNEDPFLDLCASSLGRGEISTSCSNSSRAISPKTILPSRQHTNLFTQNTMYILHVCESLDAV